MCEFPKIAAAIIVIFSVFVMVPKELMGADKEYGQYLSAECNACHGSSKSASVGIPSLNGKPFQFLVKALEQYKNKSRKNPVMQMIAGRLDPEQINALAAYFSSLGKSE